MTENQLKAKLRKALLKLPGAVVMNHSDRFRIGDPDTSVTWNGYTTWFEIKHAIQGRTLSTAGIQTLKMIELARAGRAWFVIYYELKNGTQQTLIVDPNVFHADTWSTLYKDSTLGFDHDFVRNFIYTTHVAGKAYERT